MEVSIDLAQAWTFAFSLASPPVVVFIHIKCVCYLRPQLFSAILCFQLYITTHGFLYCLHLLFTLA